MPVCRYFQQGNCHFGDSCRYEHTLPGSSQNYGGGGGGMRRGGGGYGYDDSRSGGYQGRNDAGNYYQSRGRGGGGYRSGASYQDDHGYQRDYGSSGNRGDYGSRYDYNDQRSRPDQSGGYGSRTSSSYRDPSSASYRSNTSAGYRDNQGGYRDNQDGAGASNRKLSSSEPSFAEILEWISEEMSIWSKSGMWPLSTFAFRGDVRSLPGLDDLSMEEVRFLAYEAQASGQFSRYITWLQEIMVDNQAKRQQLFQPTDSMRTSLISIVEEIVKMDGLHGSSTAAGQTLTEARPVEYGSDTASLPSIFHSITPATGTAPAAAAAGPASFTGFTNPANNTSSISHPTSPTFPGFGAANKTAASSDGFRNTSAFGSSNIFGANTGATMTGQSSMGFVAAEASGMNLFGKPQGQAASHSQGLVSSNGPSGCYTPIDQLSSDERAEFDASSFTLGNVPTRPPPRELI